jgi:hypothetical protein
MYNVTKGKHQNCTQFNKTLHKWFPLDVAEYCPQLPFFPFQTPAFGTGFFNQIFYDFSFAPYKLHVQYVIV